MTPKFENIREVEAELERVTQQRNAAWRALDALDTEIERLHDQDAADMLSRAWGDHTGALQMACAFVATEKCGKEG